mmetsp:Transcript_82635/g.172975  ORF Transcript_82635/g.172975 Transcript_82635/m.172975 type:complete len:202 (+) Transcript_82635:492-1097(+)
MGVPRKPGQVCQTGLGFSFDFLLHVVGGFFLHSHNERLGHFYFEAESEWTPNSISVARRGNRYRGVHLDGPCLRNRIFGLRSLFFRSVIPGVAACWNGVKSDEFYITWPFRVCHGRSPCRADTVEHLRQLQGCIGCFGSGRFRVPTYDPALADSYDSAAMGLEGLEGGALRKLDDERHRSLELGRCGWIVDHPNGVCRSRP